MPEERAGWELSREMHALQRKRQVLRDADAVGASGRQDGMQRQREAHQDPARSKITCMYGSTLRGNWEIQARSFHAGKVA